jgi:D,D-heptose 1,7-bisphosphate phosphatase
METLLGKRNAYIDALYFCPHHPHSGYPEERKEYKIVCNCRKPAPGLLLKAAKELHINLSESMMIGDMASDVQAGINAKVKRSILIPTNQPGALLDLLKKEI